MRRKQRKHQNNSNGAETVGDNSGTAKVLTGFAVNLRGESE